MPRCGQRSRMAKYLPSDLRPSTSGMPQSKAFAIFCPEICEERNAGYQSSKMSVVVDPEAATAARVTSLVMCRWKYYRRTDSRASSQRFWTALQERTPIGQRLLSRSGRIIKSFGADAPAFDLCRLEMIPQVSPSHDLVRCEVFQLCRKEQVECVILQTRHCSICEPTSGPRDNP